jgi:hypothetical protein
VSVVDSSTWNFLFKVGDCGKPMCAWVMREGDWLPAVFKRNAGAAEKHNLLSRRGSNCNPLPLGTLAEMLLASPEYHSNAVNTPG